MDMGVTEVNQTLPLLSRRTFSGGRGRDLPRNSRKCQDVGLEEVRECLIKGMGSCKMIRGPLEAGYSWVEYSQAEGDQGQKHREGARAHLVGKLLSVLRGEEGVRGNFLRNSAISFPRWRQINMQMGDVRPESARGRGCLRPSKQCPSRPRKTTARASAPHPPVPTQEAVTEPVPGRCPV